MIKLEFKTRGKIITRYEVFSIGRLSSFVIKTMFICEAVIEPF